MLSLDTDDRVVYASSFSKTIAPGVRVGYLIGPPDLIAAITTRGGQHLHLAEHARAGDRRRVLPLRRDRRLDRRPSSRRCASAATRSPRALRAHIGDEARFVLPEGGYFLWVELPEDVDTERAARGRRRARRHVRGRAATSCSRAARNALRLAFSAVTPEQATEGARRLGEALAAIKTARTARAPTRVRPSGRSGLCRAPAARAARCAAAVTGRP